MQYYGDKKCKNIVQNVKNCENQVKIRGLFGNALLILKLLYQNRETKLKQQYIKQRHF